MGFANIMIIEIILLFLKVQCLIQWKDLIVIIAIF